MARFYLTGRLSIEGSGGLLDQAQLSGRHGRLVLARLVLARHRPVPVGELAEAIWSDEVPASVDTSLRAVVSRLRGALTSVDPHAAIDFDAGCYQLRDAAAWVDVEEATNAVDRAEGRLRRDDVAGAWPQATVAASIARRPLLPGEDAPWVAEAQGRLRRVHVRALAVLTEVWRRRGDHGLAVATARELVALEPFREASHRALMAAHAASGDVAEAVRAYEDCRRLLGEELGIDPGRETQALHRSLLRAGTDGARVDP